MHLSGCFFKIDPAVWHFVCKEMFIFSAKNLQLEHPPFGYEPINQVALPYIVGYVKFFSAKLIPLFIYGNRYGCFFYSMYNGYLFYKNQIVLFF